MVYKRIATVSVAFWGDELVVYHQYSGDTHLLNVFLPQSLVFFCFQQDLINVEELLIQMKDGEVNSQFEESFLIDFFEKLIQINILQSVNL